MGRWRFKCTGVAPTLPVNTEAPTISGTAQENQTLTKGQGVYSSGPILEYEQKWQEASSPFTTYSDIAGATATTRVLATAQVSKKVRVAERARNAAGWSEYAYSNPTDVVVVASGGALIPATQSISFGAKTRCMHGGHKMAYAGTGTLSITSQVNTSAVPVSIFTINSVKELVINGTYGAAPPSLAAGPYTVVVTDGTHSSTITVSIAANTFHIAPNAAVDASSTTTHQLYKVLSLGSTVAFGDTIMCRDGNYSIDGTTGLQRTWTITKTGGTEFSGTPPSAPYGNNWVTIRSETVSGVVGNDVSAASFGAKWKSMKFTVGSRPDMYLRFKYLEYSRDPTGVSSTNPAMIDASTASRCDWIQFDHCRFLGRTVADAATVNSSNGMSGIYLKDAVATNHLYIMDNYFDFLYNNMQIQGDDLQIVGNTLNRQYNDNKITINSPTATVGGTFAWNKILSRGMIEHSDDCQEDWTSVNDATIPVGGYPPLNIYCNISSIGARITGVSGQGAPFMNGFTAHPSVRVNNKHIRGNLYSITAGNGIYVQGCDGLDVQYNTLMVPFDGAGSGDSPKIIQSGCTSQTIGKNIVFSTSSGDDGSSLVNINTKTKALDPAICGLTGPDFGAGLVTAAQIIAAHTPAVGSVAENKGAVTSYVNWDAQTCSWPDAHSYVRPVAN